MQNCCKTIALSCICASFAPVVCHFGMISITLLEIIPEPILRLNCDERRFFIFSRPVPAAGIYCLGPGEALAEQGAGMEHTGYRPRTCLLSPLSEE